MFNRILILILILAALVAWPASVSAQGFVEVPGGYSVTDVTPDGTLVVGFGAGGAFYWRWQVDPAPTFIGGDYASAVSADGTVIVGSIQDPVVDDTVAARWTQATGWVSLGWLPNALSCPSRSNAYDVSSDGATVVGLSWDGCKSRGFRWTAATGIQELQPLDPLTNRASSISGDGSVIGGYSKGLVSRTPAFWSADTSGAVVDVNIAGEVNGLTADGSLSVGTMYASGNWSSAFMRTAGGNITVLGALNPTIMSGVAEDVSEDGNTIVGYDSVQLSSVGWMWTSSDGIVSMNDRLTALSVGGVPQILRCNAISDDGDVVVGNFDPSGPGFSGGFIAKLTPGGVTWQNLGGGTQGVAGVPYLTGSGTLVGGMPAGVALENAPSGGLAIAWVSFTSTPAAHFGGTIHAIPYNIQFLFNTSLAGTVTINTTWPVGVPSGTDVWFQFLLSDPTPPSGITLSNGLRGTTP